MGIKSGYLKIFFAAVIWGTIGVITRWSSLAPLELSFYRVLIAGIALFLILPRGQRLIILHTKHFLLIVLAGILFALDNLLFFYAIHLTSLSNAALPYNMQPIFMAIIAPLILKEKLKARYVVSFIFAVAGVGILVTPSLINISYGDIIGISFALVGALFLAVIALIAKRINIQAITFVYFKMIIAAICLLPFIKITSIITTNFTNSLVFILIIALVHTALAYILYYDGLKAVKIQHVVALTYFIPVVASLTGYFIFNEAITGYTVIGGLLIIVNGAIVAFNN
ncbi:MAG: DMT family transporter [Bacillota bacterium]|nr:DMT family transporter [Bacillota bacterium]